MFGRWTIHATLMLLVASGRPPCVQAGTATGDAAAPPVSATDAAALAAAPQATPDEVRQLVARLNAPSFERRSEASRALVALGPPAIPYLVESLGHASGEVQLRARWVLKHHTFVEVAPQLIHKADDPVPRAIRDLLREQARQHLAAVCAQQHSERLLRLWNTDAERFTIEALKRLGKASARSDVEAAITPLLDLTTDINHFERTAERLAAIPLPSDHQDGAGAIILAQLARGLRDDRAELIDFADRYIGACEAFRDRRVAEGAVAATIRQEITQRADWSRGAMLFLVQLQDANAPQRTLLEQHTTLRLAMLEEAFFRGFAASRPHDFTQEVGKVHIADMLVTALIGWTDGRDDPLIKELVQGSTAAALAGDKPRALGYLDALEACRSLPAHQLQLSSGLGRQLAQRLAQQAASSNHFKAYYPARSLHDKILSVRQRGLKEEHSAFPQTLVSSYLHGADAPLAESTRLALDRYLRALDQLGRVDPRWEQPATLQRLAEMNRALLEDPSRIEN